VEADIKIKNKLPTTAVRWEPSVKDFSNLQHKLNKRRKYAQE